MNRVVYLAPGEAMCTASVCTNPIPCARRLAHYTPGRAKGDYSVHAGPDVPYCTGPKWLHHKPCVAPPDAPQPEPKQWLGGML